MKKEPSLSDQHWRATLSSRKTQEILADAYAALEARDSWRLSILYQREDLWQHAEELARQALTCGDLCVFQEMLAGQATLRKQGMGHLFAYAAVDAGQLEAFKLVRAYFSLDLDATEGELLLCALRNKNIPVALYLLQEGADASLSNGWCFQQAVDSGSVEVLNEILGRSQNFKNPLPLDDGLVAACRNGDAEIAALLLQKGARLSAGGDIPLTEACAQGNAALLAKLLEFGLDASHDDSRGIVLAAGYGHTHILELLLAHGADINAQNGAALCGAVDRGSAETVRFLLEKGADTERLFYGDTALTRAARYGYKEMVHILLEGGADPSACRFSALLEARRCRNREIAKDIIDHERKRRLKVRARCAAEFEKIFGGEYTVEDLRKIKSPSGDTGLELAAKSGNFQKYLLRAQALGRGRLSPEDLFFPADRLKPVLSLLAETGSLRQFFASELWKDRATEMIRAAELLPQGLMKSLDISGLRAEVGRQNIKKISKNNILKPK